MLYYIYHDIKITLKSHFCRKTIYFSYFVRKRCYGRHKVSKNLQTTSCLSILLQGVISLPDKTSYMITSIKL